MATLTIDDFKSSSAATVILPSAIPGPQSVVDNGGSGVYGNYRTATVWLLSGSTTQASVTYAVTGGECNFSIGTGSTQAQLIIIWDANGAGLNLDLSSYTKLFVGASGIDHGSAPITLTIYSQGQPYYVQGKLESEKTVAVAFTNFQPKLSADALANVTAIAMCINGANGLDLGVNSIGASDG